MIIDSFDTLKSAVVDIDGSGNISGYMDTAVQLCESEIYSNELEPLKVRDLEASSNETLSTASRFLALPDRFIELRQARLVLDSYYQNLLYVTPDAMRSFTTTGRPEQVTVTSQFEFDRVPDEAYTLQIQYLAKAAPLSDANPTNAVLTTFPNIYLFGCLWAVNLRNAELEVADYYKNKMMTSIVGANAADKDGKYGPAPRKRVMGGIA